MARELAVPLWLCCSLAAPVRAQAPSPAPDFDRLLPGPSSCTRPVTCSARSTTYRAALAIAPDRADALSNLGAAYVKLGQFDDAMKQYEAALKADPANTADPHEPRAGLLQVGAAERSRFAIEARRVVGSRGEERLSDPRRLLSPDRAGPGRGLAAAAARRRCSATTWPTRIMLGTALLHTGGGRKGEHTSRKSSAPASRRRRTS